MNLPSRSLPLRTPLNPKLRRQQQLRRVLLNEQLEDRSLMAADFQYWNWNIPADVNLDEQVDVQDVLSLIYEANSRGFRQLEQVGPLAEGEGSTDRSTPLMVDVNRDAEFSVADILGTIYRFNAEGEGPFTAKVRVVGMPAGGPNLAANDPNFPDQLLSHTNGEDYLNPGQTGYDSSKFPTLFDRRQEVIGGENVAIIDKGDNFELRVFVQELNPDSLGVYTAPVDIEFDTNYVAPIVGEIQEISLTTATDITGGKMTVSYNGSAPRDVLYGSSLSTFTSNLANAIRQSVPGGSATTISVTQFDPPSGAFTSNQRYNWRVVFRGALENQDLARLVINIPTPAASGLTNTGNTAITSTVQEWNGLFSGVDSHPQQLKNTVIVSPGLEAGGTVPLYSGNNSAEYTPGVANGVPDNVNKPDGLHEVFAFAQSQAPFPGLFEREHVYVKMRSFDGTTNATGAEVPMVIGLNKPERFKIARYQTNTINDTIIPNSEVDFGPKFKLIVREYVTALDDTFTQTNIGTATAGEYTLNVLGNNGNGADFSRTSTPFAITATGNPTQGTLTGGGVGGTIRRLSNGTLGYTPPVGLQIAAAGATVGVIEDTFTYNIEATDSNVGKAAYKDTATVTVKLFAPNTPPVNNGIPATLTVNEGSDISFTGLSVEDVDNDGLVNVTMTVTVVDNATNLPVNGTLTAGGMQLGTGTNVFTADALLADLNSELANGVVFTPANLDYNGVLKFTLETNDNGSGVGSAAKDTDTSLVTVVAVNDAPVVTGPTGNRTMQEDDPPFAFSGANLITVSDVDIAAGTFTFTITSKLAGTGHGAFAVSNNAGMTVTAVAGSGSLTMTGTPAQMATALPTLTYTPDRSGNFLGNYVVDYTFSDNGFTPNPPQQGGGTMSLLVEPAARPKAVDDTFSVDEEAGDTTISDILFNDQARAAKSISGPIRNVVAKPHANLNGIYTLPGTLPAGLVTQTGNVVSVNASLLPDFYGTIEFDYDVTDGQPNDPGADIEGKVVITVNNVNDAPVRTATATTPINGTEEVLATLDLSSYFFDADGDDLDAVFVSETPTTTPQGIVGGLTTLNAVTYTPPANFNQTKTLSFRATDGTASSAGTADVDLTFANAPDAPVVTSFTIADVAEDAVQFAIPLSGRITDVDGGAIDLTNLFGLAVDPPAAGTVTSDASGLLFTPTANYNGPVSISYRIHDGDIPANSALDSNTGTITFNITPVNDNPVAADDTAQAGEGQTIQINVIANDYDVDVSPFLASNVGNLQTGTTITITQQPSIGTASVVAGRIQYIAPNLVPTQTQTTLKYTLTDPQTLVSNEATVTIDVLPKNDPPVIQTMTLTKSVAEDPSTPLSINIFTEASVSDPDTAPSLWTVEVVTAPQHGTLNLLPNGVVEYRPALNYNGPDSFVYRIADNDTIAPTNLKSSNGTVNITVTETNDPPVAVNDTQTNGIGLVIVNDANTLVNLIDVLANDNFGPDAAAIDGPLKLVAVGTSANPTSGLSQQGGQLTITADGKVSYKSPAGLKDFTDTFTYTIRDRNGTGLTTTGTATFFVQEAVPVDVTIHVFRDQSSSPNTLGDGIRQANETGYANVPVVITGTDFRGTAVNITNLKTDINGKIVLPRLLPGTYQVIQVQPAMIADGNDSSPDISTANTLVRYNRINNTDVFNLNIPVIPVSGTDTAIDLFFGEVGIAPEFRTLEDFLVSSGDAGMNLGANAAGQITWAELLPGWNNVKSVTGQLSENNTKLTLTFTPADGSAPCDLVLTLTGVNRFRLLRRDANGNWCIRIDCPPEFFGLHKFA